MENFGNSKMRRLRLSVALACMAVLVSGCFHDVVDLSDETLNAVNAKAEEQRKQEEAENTPIVIASVAPVQPALNVGTVTAISKPVNATPETLNVQPKDIPPTTATSDLFYYSSTEGSFEKVEIVAPPPPKPPIQLWFNSLFDF